MDLGGTMSNVFQLVVENASLIQTLAEVLGALSVVVVALVAHSFTVRSAKMQFIFESAKLIIDWNKTVLSKPELVEAVQSIRKAPSDSFERDYLLFNLLTYLETLWRLKQERVYSGPLVDSEIENVLSFFDGNREYLEGLLKRGYGDDFRRDMLRAFDRQTKPQ